VSMWTCKIVHVYEPAARSVQLATLATASGSWRGRHTAPARSRGPPSRRPFRERPMSRPPLPPFTPETAAQKARLAEDAWNSRDHEKVSLAYTQDSQWRNRVEFISGRAEIVAFLTAKWEREHDYRLIKEV
jgi:hypothetical protein